MLRQVMLRSSASVANSESAAVSSSTNVSRVSVCLWMDDQLSVNRKERKTNRRITLEMSSWC